MTSRSSLARVLYVGTLPPHPGGTAVSAFQNDLTYIKASVEADFDMRYLEAVSKITGVRWGA